eukprot:scaffold105647_cov92-Cyclotella_meneghiniana.AAC.2
MSSSVSSPSSATTDSLFDQSTISPASTTTQTTTASTDSSMDLSPSSNKSSKSSKSSSVRRKSFTLKHKRRVIKTVNDMRAENPTLTITKAMSSLGYKNYYYSRWVKDIKMADDLLQTRIVDVSTVPGYVPGEDDRQIHSGRKSVLEEHATTIRDKVFELRDKGLQVGVDTVMREASKLSVAFKNKSSPAKRTAASRFCKRIGLTHRKPTHVAQKHFKETEMLAKAFIEMVRIRVKLMHPHAVANMDQTPIPFCYTSNATLAPRGARTIHMLAPGEKDRCTFNAAITMAGGKLPPMIIFKGKPNGRIERSELITFSSDAFWHCQKNAWCDDRIMMSWVEKVLPVWKAEVVALCGESVIPLLILDAYKCHMQANIVTRIQDLGIEVLHIPAGCTYLCQPLDVGVNRPLKKFVKREWDDWMEAEGAVTLQKPSRKLIGEWVLKAWASLDVQHVQNSWKKKGFEWIL